MCVTPVQITEIDYYLMRTVLYEYRNSCIQSDQKHVVNVANRRYPEKKKITKNSTISQITVICDSVFGTIFIIFRRSPYYLIVSLVKF